MLGYNVLCLSEIMKEAGRAQGGLVLVVQDQPKGWSVDLTRFDGTNVVICEVVYGGKRNLIIST